MVVKVITSNGHFKVAVVKVLVVAKVITSNGHFEVAIVKVMLA